jgi:hypothetical protein
VGSIQDRPEYIEQRRSVGLFEPVISGWPPGPYRAAAGSASNPSGMNVKGSTLQGQSIYASDSLDRGRVEVDDTPRDHCAPKIPGWYWRHQWQRHTSRCLKWIMFWIDDWVCDTGITTSSQKYSVAFNTDQSVSHISTGYMDSGYVVGK